MIGGVSDENSDVLDTDAVVADNYSMPFFPPLIFVPPIPFVPGTLNNNPHSVFIKLLLLMQHLRFRCYRCSIGTFKTWKIPTSSEQSFWSAKEKQSIFTFLQ